MMEYKSYVGQVSFDDEADIFYADWAGSYFKEIKLEFWQQSRL